MWLIISAKDERRSALHWKQIWSVILAIESTAAIERPADTVNKINLQRRFAVHNSGKKPWLDLVTEISCTVLK